MLEVFWKHNSYRSSPTLKIMKPSGIADDGALSVRRGSMVPADVAPNETPRAVRWLREKPLQTLKIPIVTKR